MNDSTIPYTLRLLTEVAIDLYAFAKRAITQNFSTPFEAENSQSLSLIYELPAHVREVASFEDVTEGPATFKSTSEILEGAIRPEKNTVMYTGSENVPLFKQPTVEFDGITSRIPYGAMVMVLEGSGRWSKVVYGNTTGFVLRDELIDRAAYVYPDFTIGEKNMSDDPNTLKVRAYIEDEFGGGVAELSLQASEYVLYRLYRKGKHISWSETRPRVEGAWHELLRGVEAVRIGIQPKEGFIMEYTTQNGEGHVAYVEGVFPDETLSISEANFPDSGIYNERVLTKEEWQELKPIFIEVV